MLLHIIRSHMLSFRHVYYSIHTYSIGGHRARCEVVRDSASARFQYKLVRSPNRNIGHIVTLPHQASRAERGIWNRILNFGVLRAFEWAEAVLAVEQVQRAIRRLRELCTECATVAANRRHDDDE